MPLDGSPRLSWLPLCPSKCAGYSHFFQFLLPSICPVGHRPRRNRSSAFALGKLFRLLDGLAERFLTWRWQEQALSFLYFGVASRCWPRIASLRWPPPAIRWRPRVWFLWNGFSQHFVCLPGLLLVLELYLPQRLLGTLELIQLKQKHLLLHLLHPQPAHFLFQQA